MLSNTGATNVIEGEYIAAGRSVRHYVTGNLIEGTGVSSRGLRVDKDHQYVSVATMLVPSLDRMMGVAGLDMCDGDRWKKHVRVCGELFSTGYRTNIAMRPNTLQDRNCSFGYFDFRLMPPPKPILDRDECPERRPPSNNTRPPPPDGRPPPPPDRRPPPQPGDGPPPPPPPDSCLCQPKCKCEYVAKLGSKGKLSVAYLKLVLHPFFLLLVTAKYKCVNVNLKSV